MSTVAPTPVTKSSDAGDGMDVAAAASSPVAKRNKRKRLGTRDLSFRTSTNTTELIKRNKRLVCQLAAMKLRAETLELYIRITRKELAESLKSDASYKRARKNGPDDGSVSDDEGTIYDDVIDSVYGFEEPEFDDQ